uniref:Uncharacterized protein n=1 Tax=Salmo trutta TaxID=8032 RepID=A0A673XZM3_SALTR
DPPNVRLIFVMQIPKFYSKFFKKYLTSQPPIKQWVTEEGKPTFQKLLQQFDETLVPVANSNAKEYNANPKQIIPFKEFIHYWKEYIQNGHSSPKGYIAQLFPPVCHRDFPEHVYTTPVFFSSDWLNEYWDTLEVDDYRFVYMGPKDSWYNKTYLIIDPKMDIFLSHSPL